MLDSSYSIFNQLLSGNCAVLDYGSGRGQFLQSAGERIRKGVGIELDKRLVDIARQTNRFKHIEYVTGDASSKLPLEDDSFDVIFALGVLEHVGDEKPYLREFHRLLRPGGALAIEVPAKGPFRALDIGNVKYNFPRLHRWYYYYVARKPKYYEENFAPEAPMFGQFSRDATEHRHYSVADLKNIANPYFRLERYELVSFFFELIQFVQVLACTPFGRSSARLFKWLIKQDSRIKSPLGRAYFVGVFRKHA